MIRSANRINIYFSLPLSPSLFISLYLTSISSSSSWSSLHPNPMITPSYRYNTSGNNRRRAMRQMTSNHLRMAPAFHPVSCCHNHPLNQTHTHTLTHTHTHAFKL